MFKPVLASKNIEKDYVDYILTTRRCYIEKVNENLKEELLSKIAKGPYVSIADVYKTGKSISELIDDDSCKLSKEFLSFENGKDEKVAENPGIFEYKRMVPSSMRLYSHQEKALRKIQKGKNVVITTGTGSGKTESFLFPIFDYLMKEKTAGTLCPGVRAILIYPMNALANDQMKRLRQYLMCYPDITFGVFNGETKDGEDDALAVYEDLHQNDIAEFKKPLPNELISREQMRQNPPHILCTNYSMLEYLLLRPGDYGLFSEKKTKFIVMDESHVYRGATGIETALLIQRLKARLLEEGNNVQFILTSATLGKEGRDEADIVDFAANLTGENFDKSDVVFGETMPYIRSNRNTIDVNPLFFKEIDENGETNYQSVFKKYGLPYSLSLKPSENLYEVCESSSFYRVLRSNYLAPAKISSISNWLGLNDKNTSYFLNACSISSKGGLRLVDIKYYYFVRALEGAYMSFDNEKTVSLVRKEKTSDKENSMCMFEIAVCNRCGDIALVGNIKKDSESGRHYLFSEDSLDFSDEKDAPQYFHVVRSNNDTSDFGFAASDEDDPEIKENDSDLPPEQEDYCLCTKCGEIVRAEGVPSCGHGKYLRIRTIKKDFDNKKCLYCYKGNYQRFYLGSEASTSILATSLFESLPTKECKITDSSGFTTTFEGGKQFLTFSDSRSDAAYFASYLEESANRLLARRGYVKLLNKLRTELLDDECEIDCEDIIKKLKSLFIKERTFASSLASPDQKQLRVDAEKYATVIVLLQMIMARKPWSLQSMGYLKYEYRGINEPFIRFLKDKYDISASYDRIFETLNELAMGFAYFGAINMDNRDSLDEETVQTIFNTTVGKRIVLQKMDKNTPTNISGWLPRGKIGKSGEWYQNTRLVIARRLLNTDDDGMAIEFLKDVFSFFANSLSAEVRNDFPLSQNSSQFWMELSNFAVRLNGSKHTHWYRCSNCGQITVANIDGCCQTEKCKGVLKEVTDFDSLFKDNHYYNFYKRTSLRSCIVKEHTAQLTKKKALEYQTEFEKNEINALSCSTTFEMGVDVGKLETVFMRDIPPTPANYAQRAGRAGRSTDSSAFVISFAKLSSHDFNYFEHPIDMISGKTNPPVFSIDNQKILYRHIFSTALGYFFQKYPDYYNHNLAYNFLNKGYTEFKDLLKKGQKGDELSILLSKSFSKELDNEFSISDYGKNYSDSSGLDWVSSLIGDSGLLESAVGKYLDIISEMEKEINDLEKANSYDSVRTLIEKRKRRKKFYENPKLIEFLVNANVLPKYGFPVDTASLTAPNQDECSEDGFCLTRDTTQALSDYAPGAKVIADKKMYTSRYIKKVLRGGHYDFDEGFVAFCDCGAVNYSLDKDIEKGKKCVGCGNIITSDKWQPAIQPSAGFYTDETITDAPLKKPEKLYRSEAFYVGEKLPDSEYDFVVDGGKKIVLYSSKKDWIMVTSERDKPFYVCKECGYSLGSLDVALDKEGKQDKKNTIRLREGMQKQIYSFHKPYNNLSSKSCCKNIELKKELLYHRFNTDIVQIVFENERAIDEETKISVLYALLDAVSSVLSIERNDIAGCLRRDCYGLTRFVIYDNVPGGAGHVKRIADPNGCILHNIIDAAYEKMSNCNCSPSCYNCLRTYDNQKYHKLLNRQKVIDFLSDYKDKEMRNCQNVGSNIKPILIKSEAYSLFSASDTSYSGFRENYLSGYNSDDVCAGFKKMDLEHIPFPDYYWIPIEGFENSFVLLFWEAKNVALLDDSVGSAKNLFVQQNDIKIVFLSEPNWAEKLINYLRY